MLETHGWIMPFGKYKGERITRVPVGYLRWMSNIRHEFSEYAEEEMDRRGTVLITVEITGHAIDRASLLCRHIWHKSKNNH